jgi:hypothetical protein
MTPRPPSRRPDWRGLSADPVFRPAPVYRTADELRRQAEAEPDPLRAAILEAVAATIEAALDRATPQMPRRLH